MLFLDIFFLPKISCSIQTAYERHRRDTDERVAEYSFGAGPEIIENIDKRSSNKNEFAKDAYYNLLMLGI